MNISRFLILITNNPSVLERRGRIINMRLLRKQTSRAQSGSPSPGEGRGAEKLEEGALYKIAGKIGGLKVKSLI